MLHQQNHHTPVLHEGGAYTKSRNPSNSVFSTLFVCTETCNNAMMSTMNTTNFCISDY